MRYDFSNCVLFLVLTIETIKLHKIFLFFVFDTTIKFHYFFAQKCMHGYQESLKSSKNLQYCIKFDIANKTFSTKTQIFTCKFPNKKHSSVKIKSLIKTHIIQFSNAKFKYFNRGKYECQI
jgi:hypothetical protein